MWGLAWQVYRWQVVHGKFGEGEVVFCRLAVNNAAIGATHTQAQPRQHDASRHGERRVRGTHTLSRAWT